MDPTSSALTIDTHAFDAVLFDLDGVVTRTAKLHAAAWKALFDGYLRQRAAREDIPFQPFDADADYRRYVDGMPRYEGVHSFLRSRGIELPYGAPSDRPDQETICGLGNKKNEIFLDLLRTQEVAVFESTVALIRQLKARGVKTAIVSSSKNCATVVEVAGLSDLFDTRVDGVDIERRRLNGKPAPDIFLTAAERLGVAPARAVVVEDAIAGVQAGRNGRFGLVIGAARHDNHAALRENGADVVVADLGEISIDGDRAEPLKNTAELLSALAHGEDLVGRLRDRCVVVFLDYDGTLTPIVERPDRAFLSEDMRRAVRELANRCPVAIISGRDRADVQHLVQLDNVFYAGSHGFDIAGPQGTQIHYQQGADVLPILDGAEAELRRHLAGIQGAFIERKRFSIAVHVRGVARQDDEDAAEAIVDDVLAHHPELRKGHGKKVFELQPSLDWHKGKAVLWLLQALELDAPDVLPLYLGDDLTDEDAFRALADRGIGIVVEEAARPTAARYVLRHPDEVRRFLQWLRSWLGR